MPVAMTEVKATIARHKGNVAAAARDLGIARNNLYKRLARAEVDPDAYRAAASADDAAAERGSPAPSAGPAMRRAKALFLRPDQIAALDEAALDLAYVDREKYSPSKVLERFIDERFAEWLRDRTKAAEGRS